MPQGASRAEPSESAAMGGQKSLRKAKSGSTDFGSVAVNPRTAPP
ncbi:MAG TPA: hypothetical protein VN414_10120 [Methanosarcina sp.]|nr:hypothetical protein [Methanosarcina sp.]